MFDIVQFFSFLNHHLLPIILDKADFNLKISQFFSNYLINKHTQYVWNNFVSSFFRADVGVNQGSALLPILSALYIAPVFHILEKKTKNLSILIFIYFLAIVLFLFFLDSSVLSSSMTSQKIFISPEHLKT